MNDSLKAALIISQSALLNAEIASMQAENTSRQRDGCSLAYTEKEFAEVIQRYEPVLDYNAVLQLIRDI